MYTNLTIAHNQKYINNSEFEGLYEECYDLAKMISGLIKSIKKREK
jgi:four helix bundle protein